MPPTLLGALRGALAALAAGALGGEAKFGLRASETLQRASHDVIVRELQGELRALLGHGQSHERLGRIEDALRPVFVALPKDADGGLGQATARYALQRYFVGQHGWQVQGLERSGGSLNESTVTVMLKSKMPGVIVDLLEGHLQDMHTGLQDLAVLAATVEDLAHSDMISLLEEVYDIAFPGGTDDEWVDKDILLAGMMLFYVMPEARQVVFNAISLRKAVRNAAKGYPGWDSLLLWASDLEAAVAYQDRTVHFPFGGPLQRERDFRSLGRLAGVLNEQFGRFQNLECKALKNKLLDLDDDRRRDGRVALSKFYGGRMQNGDQTFVESPQYLRHLGALDESDPSRPSVVIPNYIYGRSNCLAASSFLSVCCINECDSLMATLEAQLARPAAAPAELAALVARLPSETAPAPRNLSAALLERLGAVAADHNGVVPLHGRLFAQWMHLAFPSECPFPQVAAGASAASLSVADFNSRYSDRYEMRATEEQMMDVMQRSQPENETEDTDAIDESRLPWIQEEELFTEHLLDRLQERQSDGPRAALRVVCMVMAVTGSLSLLMGLRGSLLAAQRRSGSALPSWARAAEDKVAFV